MLKVDPGVATALAAARVVATEPGARVGVMEPGEDMAQVQGTAMAPAMAAARVVVMEPGAARARDQGVAKEPGTAAAGMEKVVMGPGLTVTLAVMEDTTATVSPVITATPARVPTPAEDRVTVMGKGTAKAQDQGTDPHLTVAARLGAAVARGQRAEPGLLREMAAIRRVWVPPAMALTAQHRLKAKAHTAFTLRNHRRCEGIV